MADLVQIYNPKGKYVLIDRSEGRIIGNSTEMFDDSVIPLLTQKSYMESAGGNIPFEGEEVKEATEPPPVEVFKTTICGNTYGSERKWKVQTLIGAVEEQGCEPFDLPLSGIDLENMGLAINDLDDFILHVDIVNRCDLKYPIILSWTGAVADGLHRIAKAITEGRTSIKAYRLKRYVQPDYVEKKDDTTN